LEEEKNLVPDHRRRLPQTEPQPDLFKAE